MSEVLILNKETVKKLISMEDAINSVESAYTNFFEEKSYVYPAVRETVPQYKGIFGIKSSYLEEKKSIGLKAGGFWSENIKKDKTNHQSTMVLFNPETGEPTCLLDANYITGVRTGAAGAVAAKHLARKDSKVIGIVGAGIQARMQFEALNSLFDIEKVIVTSRTKESANLLIQELENEYLEAVFEEDIKELAAQSDIVVTTTPSFSPVIKSSWLSEGTHLNAMGSDTKGKREIEIDKHPDKMICDLWEQSSTMGESQHGIQKNEVYAEIGEITSNTKNGRENEKEITIFDSTGISVQDVEVADFVYKKAKELDMGQVINLSK